MSYERADVDSFDDLRAKVETVRRQYQHALEDQRAVVQHHSGLPHPDGAQHLHQAHEALKLALERYTLALRDLADHVLKRIEPVE